MPASMVIKQPKIFLGVLTGVGPGGKIGPVCTSLADGMQINAKDNRHV
jgi:hypothetical protein